jgi:hypothetical protein
MGSDEIACPVKQILKITVCLSISLPCDLYVSTYLKPVKGNLVYIPFRILPVTYRISLASLI